jgi:hypothetical protein
MNWRALGSMVAPDGARLVWLTRGAEEITVTAGMQLDDGYVVQGVAAEEIVLAYPPLGATVHLPLPRGGP